MVSSLTSKPSTLPSKSTQRPPSHPSKPSLPSTTLPSRIPIRSQLPRNTTSTTSGLPSLRERSRPAVVQPLHQPRSTYILDPPRLRAGTQFAAQVQRARLLDIFDGTVTTDPTIIHPPSRLRQPRAYKTKNIISCAPTPSEPTTMTVLDQQLLAIALDAEVKVEFDNEGVIDMLGGLNTGSSYSLPGRVTIKVACLPSGYEGKLRELSQLKVIFETKSEFWDDNGRYTPSRVYTTSIDLATVEKPLLIPSSDPLRSHSRTFLLAVNFDLKLPGWLPSSKVSSLGKTEHGAIARYTIGFTEAATSTYAPPQIGTRLIQTRSSKRTTNLLTHMSGLTDTRQSAYTPITVLRHRLPSAMNPRLNDGFERHYSLTPSVTSSSPIECVVTVPDWVDCNGGEKDLKISIRVRARREVIRPVPVEEALPSVDSFLNAIIAGAHTSGGVSEPASTTAPFDSDTQQRGSTPMERDSQSEILTHILELGMEVDEVETYTSIPSPTFASLFPIPEEQPSRFSTEHALIAPQPRQAIPSIVTAANIDEKPITMTRKRKCLLADDGSQRNFIFEKEGLGMSERWRKVNIVLPMPQPGKSTVDRRPRSEYESPMLRVKHILNIRVVCRNVGNDGEDVVVVLNTPIRFGTKPDTMPRDGPPRPTLPAYIQVFHENGDLRECDPLPLYPAPAPTCAPPPYMENSHQFIPEADLGLPKSPSIASSRSHSPQLSTSSRTSVNELDDAMDLDSASSSDDGHSAVSSASSSGVRPISIPPLPRVGRSLGRSRQPKFCTQPAVAATA